MPIHVSTKEFRMAGKRQRGAAKKAAILTKQILEKGMEQVKGTIQLGDFFDAGSGALQAGLWAGEAVMVKRGRVEVEGGWNSIVGPVREFGVSPDNEGGWEIGAKWAKALRFRVGNAIVYAKWLWFEWNDNQLRPHWGPTLEAKWPAISAQLDKVPEAALRNPK